VQNLQLPASQEQFQKAHSVYVESRDKWVDFFNANLQSRQIKRITQHPGIIGSSLAEKTVSWIEVKFSGADIQQLSSTLDKLEAQKSVPYPHLVSDVNTLLNWGALLIDKEGPVDAVLAAAENTVSALSQMLTFYAYNSQAGEMTDFNFEKNRMLIRTLLEF